MEFKDREDAAQDARRGGEYPLQVFHDAEDVFENVIALEIEQKDQHGVGQRAVAPHTRVLGVENPGGQQGQQNGEVHEQMNPLEIEPDAQQTRKAGQVPDVLLEHLQDVFGGVKRLDDQGHDEGDEAQQSRITCQSG